MSRSDAIDAVVVVPPLSPSDTNPPLGPYLLKACAERRGLRVDVADLSVRHLNRFKGSQSRSSDYVLGDQDKDRAATHAARDHFRKFSPLVGEPTLYLPCSSDPMLGMHYSFDSVERAVSRACEPTSEYRRLVEEDLFAHYPVPPHVLGLSIMGPAQVLMAFVVARLAKRRWPRTQVIAGGSHITLLADQIAQDSRYGGDIGLFMAGHCEVQFAEVVQHVTEKGCLPTGYGIRAGAGRTAVCDRPAQLTLGGRSRSSTSLFEYLPSMDRRATLLYDTLHVTLPMQLTRGCSFGRCSYCTYPAVEPAPDIEPDWARALAAVTQMLRVTGVHRFSFKDSYFTPRNLRSLAHRLCEAGLNIEWSATTLLHDALSARMLQELHRSGCRTLEFGLETIDPIGQQVFGKLLDVGMCERVISDATDAGIAVVINQILGWPGQTLASAEGQLAWYRSVQSRSPELIHASLNMLEVNRGAPMSKDPQKYGIVIKGFSPWAFSADWNAPAWRATFALRSQVPPFATQC